MNNEDLILGEIRVLRAEMREDVSKLHSKLDTVHEQTTRTNGRVTRLEGRETEINQAIDYVKKCSSPTYQIGQLLITIGSVTTIIAGILYFLP